ncbi:porin family protein [Desulfoluna butyratoxydans]|uniref:Outer membrane protein beta-barrel n=1 Tax=Desulfoluna butyratoxydans TaxID=231438 RepID=A0A4V6ILU5_9BACT|nr:porin family protein [Desulfoluna butyratoxydans]VFQ46508.1 outer membrane protein beta-barrel [Desulfoluna butyratoxydans]
MKKSFKSLLLSFCAIFVISPCYAMEETTSPWSFGVGGSNLHENIDTGSNGIDFDESVGFNVRLGYRVSDSLEAEIDYLYIDGFDGSVAGIEAFELDGYAITANAKWYPSKGKVQPYCLVGAGFADLTASVDFLDTHDAESDWGTVLRAGAGVDAYISEKVFFFGEISYYLTCGDIDDNDFMPMTIGVKRTF